MDAKLVIVKGKANKDSVPLKLPTVIGRSREADLTIAHPMVSRKHCELFEANGLIRIRDLQSSNGTFVGNQQVQEADLLPHTEFSIGPLTFRVEYDYVGPIASAPEFFPAPPVGAPPAGVAAAPDFQPMADAPTPANVSATPGRPANFVAPDAGVPDFSAWTPALNGGQIAPQFAPEPARPFVPANEANDTAEQAAAQALAESESEESTGETPIPSMAQFAAPAPETVAEAASAPPVEPEETIDWQSDAPAVAEAAPGEIAEQPAAALGTNGSTSAASDEAPAADDEAAESEAQPGEKKRKGWWPFGRGKKKAKDEKPPASEEPVEEGPPQLPPPAPAAPTIALPAQESHAEEAVSDFISALDSADQASDSESDSGNESLNAFLKGLK